MKRFTTSQFKKLADAGRIHKATGNAAIGEHLCETPLEFGITNGYSLADICHFYRNYEEVTNSGRDKPLTATQVNKAAHQLLVMHLSHLAATAIDYVPDFSARFAADAAAAEERAQVKNRMAKQNETELCEDCGKALDKCACVQNDEGVDHPEEPEEEWPS